MLKCQDTALDTPKSYFVAVSEIKGRLLELPKTVTATVVSNRTWSFVFRAASSLSTLAPLAFLATIFVLLA